MLIDGTAAELHLSPFDHDMNPHSHLPFLLLASLLIVAQAGVCLTHAQPPGAPEDTAAPSNPDTVKGAPYVPTPRHIVLRMLQLADLSKGDVVYDLGSGDGRIVLAAAEEYGVRGVGVEIDSSLVQKSRKKARQLGLADRVTFRRGDLFDTDLSEATVVVLYLWPDMNNRLRSKLQTELDPGDRVVSHSFDIDGWEADTTVQVRTRSPTGGTKKLFRWTIPDSSTGAQ